jgi:GxxExxY protein
LNHEDTKETKFIRTDPKEEADRWSNAVIGAAIAVHKALGPGFLEGVYEEALCIELERRNIPFRRQVSFDVNYADTKVGEGRIDLIIGGCLIIELKAIDGFAPIHTAQAISYLRATGLRLALLINFNVPVLKDGIKRIIL